MPDDSDGALSGGDVELSVDVVSDRGVSKASVGTPESARRRQRGVEVSIYETFNLVSQRAKGVSYCRQRYFKTKLQKRFEQCQNQQKNL